MPYIPPLLFAVGTDSWPVNVLLASVLRKEALSRLSNRFALEAVVAVVAFPDKAPKKVGAVTVLVKFPVPLTSNLYPGPVVPMPTLPLT